MFLEVRSTSQVARPAGAIHSRSVFPNRLQVEILPSLSTADTPPFPLLIQPAAVAPSETRGRGQVPIVAPTHALHIRPVGRHLEPRDLVVFDGGGFSIRDVWDCF